MADNAIILLSGGLDSVTTAYYVKNKIKPKNIIALFFDYGQRTLKQEERCAKIISKKLKAKFKKIELKWLGDISTSFLNKKNKLPKIKDKYLADIKKGKKEITKYWVPCRNSLFLLTALAHAESEFISKKQKYNIFIGLKSEGRIPMKDTTPKFVKVINNLAREATDKGNFKIIAPLIDKDKDEIIELGMKLKVPYEFTYSCYSGSKFKNKIPVHCGTCENCVLRKKGFYWANVKDPSVYK
ncbi:MAG: 7-cyano-7-deazaguanine synthase [Candidatus Nanoarchaeia archaeon]|nr:7-cyano-7-deazaguanine synthase [Candidatus Nanoarchaeia archaeon]